MTELMVEQVIDATPETIWPFLTDSEMYVRWSGTEAEIDARPGGVHRVLIGGHHRAVGEYVEVVPLERLVFTFGWDEPGNPITPGSTTIEITLSPEGDKTRVRLLHRGLPDDALTDHRHGWENYLGRLAVAAPGGDAGPDVIPTPES